MAQIIKSTPGAIGYVDYADAKASGLTFASVKNKAGNYVAPSVAVGLRRRRQAPPSRPNLTFSAIWASGAQRLPDHLPVVGSGLPDAAERERRGACSRRTSATWSATASKLLPGLGYAPLPSSLDQMAKAQLSKIGIVIVSAVTQADQIGWSS